MGCVSSNVEKSEREIEEKKVKNILLLGPHNAGKTSLVRHLQLACEASLTPGSPHPKRIEYVKLVRDMVLESIKALFELLRDFDMCHPQHEHKAWIEPLCAIDTSFFTPADIAQLENLFVNESFLGLFPQLGFFLSLQDLQFVVRCVDHVQRENFVPTDEEIIRCQWPSVGLVSYRITTPNFDIRLHDVGGHLHQRRKWDSYYERDLSAVLFVVSLDSCWLSLSEDGRQNRMSDTLQLFRAVCQQPRLKSASKIIVLNKVDVFELELARRFDAFKHIFPDYDGEADSKRALEFLQQRFVSIATSSSASTPSAGPAPASSSPSHSQPASQDPDHIMCVALSLLANPDSHSPLRGLLERYYKHFN
eukprot:TRINITY_DN246_c0_g1_i1.p1 TRINITY_DN246_c0_g1~~TRINITY_DN246_c0_g1_i1.p1  ORF type:complete len:363 (+),score=59.02 TRINITY_DN246_c0_g1_i1:186-1274(+)